MKPFSWIAVAVLGLCAPLLSGCQEKPHYVDVSAATPNGGVVRFSGNLIGDVVRKAQQQCQLINIETSAVPIGFYRLTDGNGHDQLMTFECKKEPRGE